MARWKRALDAAGVRDPGLRADYSRQRRQVMRYKPEITLAAGLLMPGRMVPHLIAAAWFMHHTDTLLDSGPVAGRRAAFARWRDDATESLAAGRTAHPELRALLNSARAHPVLHDRVRDYLDAADWDLDFTGFATDGDYQAYVDGYALPGAMVVLGLLGPEGDQSAYRAACRTFIDACQRLDFVNDLAEDLAGGRLYIPEAALERHGVTRADLEQGRDLPGVRALIDAQLDEADRTMARCADLPELAPPAHRPLLRCLIGTERLTLTAARTAPAALLHDSAGPSKSAALRLLVREYLRARRSSTPK
ncbi:squalene/phytoene synthase family protein [Streptomyces sp. NPDC029216]|uniref:phytoene/squalene synthase family protein n=1 Tax=Streptomyces sp. NPDC029216 TaxID=3154701 RepID=UPI0033E90DBA